MHHPTDNSMPRKPQTYQIIANQDVTLRQVSCEQLDGSDSGRRDGTVINGPMTRSGCESRRLLSVTVITLQSVTFNIGVIGENPTSHDRLSSYRCAQCVNQMDLAADSC